MLACLTLVPLGCVCLGHARAAGGQGDGGRKARQYIEDEATGEFYKLHSKRRRLFNLLKRKEAAEMVWGRDAVGTGGRRHTCARRGSSRAVVHSP